MTTVLHVPTESEGERVRVAALRLDTRDVEPNVSDAGLENVVQLWHEGIEVNDDNQPAPENVQTATPPSTLFSVGE